MGKANLDVFAETLREIAWQDRDVVVVVSDSRGSAKLSGFCATLPGQVVEVGIAEQNLVSIAAGLASAGKKVFAVSPACFLTTRSLEQVKHDVAYSDLPVKLVGISAGVSYGALGSTHHALHDLAALQAIPNIDIVVPADNFETRAAIRASIDHPRPLYLRFGKRPLPDLYPAGAEFAIGRAQVLRSGADAAILATGETVCRAVEAAQALAGSGIACSVVSVPTLKPLDERTILKVCHKAKAVVTVEEHSIYGGLGSRCAALLMENGVRAAFKIMGIPDEPAIAGSQEEILEHYGLTSQGVAGCVRQILVKEGVH